MLTVFLVDDEFTILEGLKRLFDWEKAGFQVIGESRDGDDAYEAIHKLKPDIVLTDIRMPGLCGIDLIKTFKEEGLESKFIIISGYDDFSYCLEALRLGVSDYILKPIDFAALGAKLNKVAGSILEARLGKETSSALQKASADARNFKLNRYFSSVLENSTGHRELISDISNEDLPREYCYCVCVVDRYEGGMPCLKPEEYGNYVDYLYALEHGGKLVHILGFQDKNAIQFKISEYISWMKVFLEREASLNVSAGVGPVGRLERICDSYRQAYDKVENEIFYHISPHKIPTGSLIENKSENCLKAKINSIVHAIRNIDYSKVNDEVNSLFTSISEIRLPKLQVEALLKETSVLIGNMFYEKEPGLMPYSISQPTLEQIGSVSFHFEPSGPRTLENYQKAYKLAVLECVDQLAKQYEQSRNPFTRVKEYIDSHYMEDLSLKALAGVFHLNSSYLSRLFKEKCDINYSDYLNMVRIEKSKKILASSLLSVNEVSDVVGFADYRYFTKVFKKYQGVSPQVYRKNFSSIYGLSGMEE